MTKAKQKRRLCCMTLNELNDAQIAATEKWAWALVELHRSHYGQEEWEAAKRDYDRAIEERDDARACFRDALEQLGEECQIGDRNAKIQKQ